jgi:hypothetical protein
MCGKYGYHEHDQKRPETAEATKPAAETKPMTQETESAPVEAPAAASVSQ